MSCIREGVRYKRHNYKEGICAGCGKEKGVHAELHAEAPGEASRGVELDGAAVDGGGAATQESGVAGADGEIA